MFRTCQVFASNRDAFVDGQVKVRAKRSSLLEVSYISSWFKLSCL